MPPPRKRSGARLNIPNQLAVLRLGMVALYVISLSFDWPYAAVAAFSIFILASFTDWLDGYIARKYDMVTDLGKLLDPLADKILVCSAFISLVALGIMPFWMVVVIIAREFMITGLRTLAAAKNVILAAEKVGKHKTATQILSVLAALGMLSLKELGLENEVYARWLAASVEPLFYLAVIITVISGIMYFYKNRFLFDEEEEEQVEEDPASTEAVTNQEHTRATTAPAFKEWSCIVEALGQGAQFLILRKGGIHEGKGGFQVGYERFWLFPTEYHQQEEKTLPEAAPYAEAGRVAFGQRTHRSGKGQRGKVKTIELRYAAEVVEAHYLTDWEEVASLGKAHLWTEETVRERFEWSKETGVTLLMVRVYRAEHPPLLDEDAEAFGGCKSWIEVPALFENARLVPVLTTEEFNTRRGRLLSRLDLSSSSS